MNGLGRHILAELYGCPFEQLDDLDFLQRVTLDAVARSGASIVSHHFQRFQPQGVSGVVVIAESHLSFHTWPEHGYIAIDYFTCGEQVDIHLTIDLLERALGPDHSERTMHWRGEELASASVSPQAANGESRPALSSRALAPVSDIAGDRERWVTDYHLDPVSGRRELGFQYLVVREVHRRRSQFQDIRVVEGSAYGRMLLLDGAMMTTERDEFVYHEMLAHVPLLLHPEPRRICIIGGGDGGLLREVLRHEAVEDVDLVELDPEVIEVCREFLPGLAVRFGDPRVTVHAQDGARFLAESPAGQYDAILVDSTDPVGAAKALFEAPFYRNARRALCPGGVFAAQALSPFCQASAQARMFGALGLAFDSVRAYFATVPTYPGGMWIFALARDGDLDLTAFDPARARSLAQGCHYYTPELQLAAFHLPAFARRTTLDAVRTLADRAPADRAPGEAAEARGTGRPDGPAGPRRDPGGRRSS